MTRAALLWLAVALGGTGCFIPLAPCDADCQGCCRDGVCVAGTSSNECGARGAACQACSTGSTCVEGACTFAAGGGGAATGGGTGGGGGGGSAGGGSATGGGGGGSPCVAPLTSCQGRCVSTQVDREHCGACGLRCGSGQACVSGRCTANPADCRQAPCLAGFYCDLSSGACREGCSASAQCAQPGSCDVGTRACVCQAGTHLCGDACVPNTSAESCGPSCLRCEQANATAACTNGACAYTCKPGFNRCGGQCVREDEITHCGPSCTVCPAPPANGFAECVLAPVGGGAGGGGGGVPLVHQCRSACSPGFLKCPSGCCRAVALSAGGDSTCAVTSDATVSCWGELTRSTTPREVAGFDAGVRAVTVGTAHACALRADSRAQCWGYNEQGQLGDDSGDYASSPVDVVGGLTFSNLTAGGLFTCGVTTAGAAKCWGDNHSGQIGIGSYSPMTCTLGDCHFYDVPYSVRDLSAGVESIKAGWGHACARLTTGAMRCWGRNIFGELGIASPTSFATPRLAVDAGVTELVTGGVDTCFMSTSGLQCFGSNTSGELGAGLPLRTTSATPVSPLLPGITRAWGGLGSVHCATTASGLWCWGRNNRGQVGDGTQLDRNTPVAVSLPAAAATVTSGDEHTCALTTEGAVLCWGKNDQGQLGDGASVDRAVPTQVSGR